MSYVLYYANLIIDHACVTLQSIDLKVGEVHTCKLNEQNLNVLITTPENSSEGETTDVGNDKPGSHSDHHTNDKKGPNSANNFWQV